MESKAKLIILYGFAASGKTTIAKTYIDNHPLSMMIEGDEIINMMGQWRKYENDARVLVFKHTCSIVKNQLQAGHAVILPYLLTDATHINSFIEIANEVGTPVYEIYLSADKENAIAKLLKRGVWGEEGSPSLTENDRPEIEELFTTMSIEMAKRPGVMQLEIIEGDIGGTYQKFLGLIPE